MNNKEFGILLLVLMLVMAVCYIMYLTIQDYKIVEQEKIKNMTLGNYTQGLQDAGDILFNNLVFNVLQCKPIPLNYIDENNQTQQVNLIAIECLNQGK